MINFESQFINTKNAKIKLIKGGNGFPVLLLHGYPQTHFMWHKIANDLASNFTVIATDLRGYGDSSKPLGNNNYSNYSKRTLAADQVEVMAKLGYDEFYLVGHDRGGRVAHRLALDYGEKVKKLIVLDIVPTYDMYLTTDKEFASSYYHWFFLIQPYPLPENLIGGNPEFFLRNCLQSWGKDFSAFTEEALSEYIRCFQKPETIHGTCCDYRAAASIDLEHDYLDLSSKIQCPVLVLWGKKGLMERKYNVLEIWQQKAIDVKGKAINCGHFLPEEAPEETLEAIRDFLSEKS